MAKKKHDPRSEAAQRAAIRIHKKGRAIRELCLDENGHPETHYYLKRYGLNRPNYDFLLAIFRDSDSYRKREPLKDFTKSLRKAVQPRRKRRKKS